MLKDKSILILGTGVMQIPALTAARKMGLKVYAADVNDKAPGISLAHEFLHVDLRNREEMAEAAAAIARSGGLHGVFTAGTDFSTTVAWVAEKLGLPGISYETALNATDKARMRGVFSRAGIPSPPFCLVEGTADNLPEADLPPLPVVVKPVDNMGARGIRRIDNRDDLGEAVTAALAFSGSRRCIVEGYIPGPEFSIDSLVYRGRLTVCGFADRHIVFPPCFVEMGHTIPSVLDDKTRDRIVEVFTAAALALGIDNGAAKGDVKLSPEGPVIGEIAARLSGGYMSGWTYPYASGVPLTEAALRIALGLDPGNLLPARSWYSAERAFISIPGIIESIEGREEAEALADVRDVFIMRKPGDSIVFPGNNVEKCGNLLACAAKREDAVNAAEEGVRKMLVRLRPDTPSTCEFLFGRRPPQAPDAFILADSRNISSFGGMPSSITLPGPGAIPDGTEDCELRVFKLPCLEKETHRDWHGNTLSAVWNRIIGETGVTPVDWNGTASDEGLKDEPRAGGLPAAAVLGKLFWTALLRGGVQGGLWIIDTVRKSGFDGPVISRMKAACTD